MLDPSTILIDQGLDPDSWQRDLLLSRERLLLLNCSRQSGKSTTVAALALHQILTVPGSLVLLAAPAERQSHELFRKVLFGYLASGRHVGSVRHNQSELELANGSRIVALPGREQTIRSFSGVNLLILDEAARVPDDLYRSVRPMLAVSQGRLVALSTPFGQRGWFYEEWSGAGPWQRLHIPWTQCPRITPEFIAEETRALGPYWVDQEYNALFTVMEGLVFPEFGQTVVASSEVPPAMRLGSGKCPGLAVGGIDFGWRNPFAAIWGFLDDDDVLWITDEHYSRETPLAEHAAALPRSVTWFADPAGRTEIEELRRAGLTLKKADNNIRRGIALVSSRLRTGKLKVLSTCRNLIQEAKLYRYPTSGERQVVGENPIDAHNHALAALRYLVSRLHAVRPSVVDASEFGTPASRQPIPQWDVDDDDDDGWISL